MFIEHVLILNNNNFIMCNEDCGNSWRREIEFAGVTLLFIFKGQYQIYDVLNLAMANLSIIGQFCAENNKQCAP